MRLTTKGRFAVTAMLDLALHAQDGPVALATSARGKKFRSPISNSCSANCVAVASLRACAVQAVATIWVARSIN